MSEKSSSTTSLRNEIDISILYVDEDGKRGIKKVHITFISQGIYKEYNALQQELLEAVKLGERIKTIPQDMGFEAAKSTALEGDLKASREEVKGALARLKKEYEEALARLNEISAHIDEKKFALIKKILIKNGIDDRDMLDPSWWEECVNMEEAMQFIQQACTKDNAGIDDKKKEKNSMTTE